jgi:hypothetical protein
METIRELFSKPIDRRIEEVIKVDQADEKTVLDELQEYVITESIGDHFTTVYKAIADAPSEPHEGIGIWVSGFFGSGKSSFAKIIGYTVGGRTVCGQSASHIVREKARQELSRTEADTLVAYLDVINAKIPTHAIIFDVSMDRGVRTANERITEIMYKALLRELGYAEDFDLAELEISLEADGLLDKFREEFQALHSNAWEVRRKLGRGINEASAVLNKLDQHIYPKAVLIESQLACADIHMLDGNRLQQFLAETGLRERPIYGRILSVIQQRLKDADQLGSLLRLDEETAHSWRKSVANTNV